MALLRTYSVGDDVALRSSHRGDSVIVLTTPEGVSVPIPTDRSTFTFRVTVPGKWMYQWGSDSGSIDVTAGDEAEEVVPDVSVGLVEGG